MPLPISFLELPILTEAKIIVIDSRLVVSPSNSIFFAIKGERQNGHLYIKELIDKGVTEFVIEEGQSTKLEIDLKNIDLTNIKFWKVENSIATLQTFVTEHRTKFKIPIIGITGSNGKTIVKEWLSKILEAELNVIKNPRSYNSQVGVPLSVFQIENEHEIGVFEAGISKPFEMEKLEAIIKPSIGILTNIGSAHDEGFISQKQKISEKLKLFRKSKTLIYHADNQVVEAEIKVILKAVNPKIRLIGWRFRESVLIETKEKKAFLKILFQEKANQFQVNFTDKASLENIIHCIHAALFLGLSETTIQTQLNLIQPVEMRLSMKQGIQNSTIIDDSYNNDLAGLETALDFMNQQGSSKTKVLIISDLFQTGYRDDVLISKLRDLIIQKGVQEIYAIGEKLIVNKAKLEDLQIQFFDSTEQFIGNFSSLQLRDKLVLVKGSRVFEFEKIVARLSQKTHQTVLEINLNALNKNLNFYKQKIGSETKIMAMVKAFAYGAGSIEIAELLQYNKVDYLAVAYTDEGVILRQNGIKTPILVLNPQPETFSQLIDYQLEPEIYCFEILNELINSGINLNELKIHLKFDTGMHRLGFDFEEIEQLMAVLVDYPNLKIASIFSHLSSADGREHDEFTKNQIKIFTKITRKIISYLPYKPILHLSNSAGIIAYPAAKFDMVRLGIGLYGYEPSGQNQELETVATLKTVISQIKKLKAGTTVGYSRKGILEKDAVIATIAIGYADGFDRRFSGGIGEVLVNGELCKTVGNVCMDMTMIDVTNVPCQIGDEVIIFGQNPSIKTLAEKANTIPYEILTGVSERVKRVFYKN